METLVRVAFVCPRMTNPLTRIVWYSLLDSAAGFGLQLTAVLGGPLDHPREPVPARRVYDLLDERNFDGVLLYTAGLSFFSTNQVVEEFVRGLGALPLVSFGVLLDGVASVAVDQAGAVGELVRHLHGVHGCRRFAFVTGPLEQLEPRIRRTAFYDALAELDVHPDQVEEFPGTYSRESGAEAVRALAGHLVPAPALFCTSDEQAFGAREACRSLGIAVPSQLAIVGFDDVELAGFEDPALTTVGLPLIEQAGKALELLVKRMGGSSGPVHEELPARVRYRGSCGCTPPKPTFLGSGKGELLSAVLATQTNVTKGFRAFAQEWLSDYLTAFEHLLETGNSTVLRTLWNRYFARVSAEQERGIPFRTLFSGLEVLYSDRPGFEVAFRENTLLAGGGEALRSIRVDQGMREFFFRLHAVELQIMQINDRETLVQFPFGGLSDLGISGLALVRFGAPPSLVYFRAPWAGDDDPGNLGTIEYPTLLPLAQSSLDQTAHRIVVSLTAEKSYLGYAVFWVRNLETFVCDFLANQFSGALQRLELLERVGDQRESLRASLEEMRRMQQQLVETEKVASLGRLVAGVAHEINTPLGTGITGASYLLERMKEVQADFNAGTLAKSGLGQFLDQGRAALDGVLRNLMKAGELIQAFKGLGLDHGQGEWKPIEARALFTDLEALYNAELGKRGVSLRCEFPPKSVLVYTQPSALVQVAGELLENAMEHAFPQDFTGVPQVLLQVEVSDGVLRIAVTDNGRGLEPEERRHIFDPLYTTRRTEGHSGLGLHLAFQLVTRTLGGHMTVASEPGAGSCFLCSIPLKTP